MCGIVGYIGNKEAYPILIKGLKRLEYRGYDSAGVAMIGGDNKINLYKTKGKVANLEEFARDKDLSGTIGIAHTRWATHGEPSVGNAHPHYSASKSLALIHNGIIENYSSLKTKLEEKGVKFRSSTDTEVLVQLIEYTKQTNQTDLLSAVQTVLQQVVGAYAIAIVDRENPDVIIVARKSSPLVIGIGEKEFFIASDATPIVEYTDKVVYLEDEEIGYIERGKELKIISLNNLEKKPEIQRITLNIEEIEKGGYPHFMIKEIFDQPNSLRSCMKGRIDLNTSNITLSAVRENKERLVSAKRFIIVACGTSWHAGLIGKQLLEEFCRIRVEVEYASEFRYRNPVVGKDDVVIAISQSGETADTLAAVQLAKEKGAFLYGICNSVGASIPRATHTGSYIHVGPEIGVASTKAFTGQVAVLTMLALILGREKKTLDEATFRSILKEFNQIPDKMQEVLKLNDKIAQLSQTFTYAHNFIYLGRGYSHPVALEGALKLKEISYIHAEGYPAAEMKHGPIALVDAEMPLVVLATKNDLYEKIVSNIQEIKARKGRIITLITKGDSTMPKIADFCIELPNVPECLTPLISAIPLQLLAYHIAVWKGVNVDQPRNLAKSVTVE